MSDVLKFGTLLFDGHPVISGSPYPGGVQISFTDSIPGFELAWTPILETKRMLVAQSVLLTNISWRQLRDLGFVDGKTFTLNGGLYFMRLPWLGAAPGKANELAGVLADPSFAWGHEQFISFADGKRPEQQISAYGGPNTIWTSFHPAEKKTSLGFRPVLEPGLNS